MPPEPIGLHADCERLSQVLLNLLNNATKYTPRGGWHPRRASATAVEVTSPSRDNGVGIPADMLDAVFGMFTQVDVPRERAPAAWASA